jgi:endonuclease III
MNKVNVKVDVLRKMISRLVKAAPARRPEVSDPLARLIRAFMEYDCDEARASHADRKILESMVDYNELRVTPAIELAALLGVRYPFAESRCSALHRTLQSIFDREHQMRLERLKEMKKTEIRPYFQSLAGITPYVEAAVCLDAFAVPAAPVDTKLLLWLISKDVLPEGTDIKSAQHVIEKHLKATEAEDFFHGSRREIDDWSPKSWPQVAKVYSPILAPPPIGAIPEMEDAPGKRDGKKVEAVKETPKAKPAAAGVKKK